MRLEGCSRCSQYSCTSARNKSASSLAASSSQCCYAQGLRVDHNTAHTHQLHRPGSVFSAAATYKFTERGDGADRCVDAHSLLILIPCLCSVPRENLSKPALCHCTHPSRTVNRFRSMHSFLTECLHKHETCTDVCADEIVNICFTVEAILRIAAMGSVTEYFSSGWNTFDFVIVSLGYLSYVDLGQQATGVRALRGFRALRPLRGMKFFRPLRIVVDCFLQVCILSSLQSQICTQTGQHLIRHIWQPGRLQQSCVYHS